MSNLLQVDVTYYGWVVGQAMSANSLFVTITTQMFCLLWTRITRYQPGFERLGPVCFSKTQLFAEARRAFDSLIKEPPENSSPTCDKSLLWPETGPCLELSVVYFFFRYCKVVSQRLGWTSVALQAWNNFDQWKERYVTHKNGEGCESYWMCERREERVRRRILR